MIKKFYSKDESRSESSADADNLIDEIRIENLIDSPGIDFRLRNYINSILVREK